VILREIAIGYICGSLGAEMQGKFDLVFVKFNNVKSGILKFYENYIFFCSFPRSNHLNYSLFCLFNQNFYITEINVELEPSLKNINESIPPTNV
jgi:hypothetical protein